MSTSTTTNLSLIKEGGDEYIKTHRAHANANLDAVDTAIGNINSAVTALQNAITNANALLGTLGVDGNGDPLISAASARATLDAAQDDSSGITLADAASNISTLLATTGIASTPSGKTLQGQISTLQDSVSGLDSSVSSKINGAGAMWIGGGGSDTVRIGIGSSDGGESYLLLVSSSGINFYKRPNGYLYSTNQTTLFSNH